MKKTYLLIILFLTILPFISVAQISLTIEIQNLRSNAGEILLQIYDENQNKIKGVYGKIVDKKSVIIIENLIAGKYAFKYFHDENKNDKLDSNWLGIPNEGYGFSNNAKGTFGPPSFEKWIFELLDNKKMICSPIY